MDRCCDDATDLLLQCEVKKSHLQTQSPEQDQLEMSQVLPSLPHGGRDNVPHNHNHPLDNTLSVDREMQHQHAWHTGVNYEPPPLGVTLETAGLGLIGNRTGMCAVMYISSILFVVVVTANLCMYVLRD